MVLTRSKARAIKNKRKRSASDEIQIIMVKRTKNDPNPMMMGTILAIVLSFLDAESIKTARQVNKFWSIEGAKILVNKCYVKIPSDLRVEGTSTKKAKNNNMMKMFKAFLSYKSNDISMIPNVTVSATADFELWKSLGVLGQQVNSLKLTNIDDKKELLHKFLVLLPNLKYLNLHNESNCFKGLDIIKVLTSVMSKSLKNKSPLVISHIPMLPASLEEFKELEKFSKLSNIKFEELRFQRDFSLEREVPSYEARQAAIISKLLKTSQNTLKELNLIFCEPFLSLIQFPRLNQLTSMALGFFELTLGAVPQYSFSSGFRFSEKVPNLYQMHIDCTGSYAGGNFLANFFDETGTAPSVKFVSYIESLAGFPVEPPFKHFPNTEHFNVVSSKYTTRVFHSVYKHGRNVKTLHMSINLDQSFAEIADLDSALTGITPETVEWIKKVPQGVTYAIDDVKKLRVNPSLLDLRDLQVLDLQFIGTGQRFLPENTLAFAGKYIFKVLPAKLRICMVVTDKEPAISRARAALEQVSKLPNVTLRFDTIA